MKKKSNRIKNLSLVVKVLSFLQIGLFIGGAIVVYVSRNSTDISGIEASIPFGLAILVELVVAPLFVAYLVLSKSQKLRIDPITIAAVASVILVYALMPSLITILTS
ncbi:hypothetical protein KC951_00120 [Candidatus Saccharibacteria bacterium]|nr:hypothetical protein [Candidatus Saccharibacteria bacterium]